MKQSTPQTPHLADTGSNVTYLEEGAAIAAVLALLIGIPLVVIIHRRRRDDGSES